MTDEMKLITALCEALGFDVNRKEEVTKGTFERTIDFPPVYGTKLFPEWKEYEFIGDGKYVEVIRKVSYSLTRKDL